MLWILSNREFKMNFASQSTNKSRMNKVTNILFQWMSFNIIFMLQQQTIDHLRQQLVQTISRKNEEPTYTPKYTLNWKKAELTIINTISDLNLLRTILQFQSICLKNRIPCFHSFFVLQWATSHPLELEPVQKQIEQLSLNKSKCQRIMGYIKMRESLMNQMNNFSGKKLNELFESIDQIRFLTFEIITLIKGWKQQWRSEHYEPLFYERGANYLLKINNDNADIINLANFKKTKFISPPNPFFLSEDGNRSGMSEAQRAQMESCINLIAKQRIFEIKLAFQGAVFVSSTKDKEHSKIKRQAIQQNQGFSQDSKISLERQVRQKRQMLRQSEIKKIYAFKESVSSSKLRAMKQETQKQVRKESQEQKERNSMQNLESMKKVQNKLSQLKYSSLYNPSGQKGRFGSQPKKRQTTQHTVVNQKLKKKQEKKRGLQKQKEQIKSRERLNIEVKGQQLQVEKEALKYKLSPSFSKTLLLSKQQLKSSKLVEVRQIKPKIKLVSQKEVFQPNVNIKQKMSKLLSNSALQDSRSASFYKPIQSIVEEGDQVLIPTKKKTSNVYTLKSSTQIGFGRPEISESLKKEEKQIQEKQTSIVRNRNRVSRLSESALQASNSKSLSIIKIYKNSLNKSRTKKIDQVIGKKMVEQNTYLTEVPEPIVMKYAKKQQKAQIQSQNQLYKIATQLNQKSKINSELKQKLVQKSKIRAEAEQKLTQKEKLISQLQSKIKQLQNSDQKQIADLGQSLSKSQNQSLLNRQKKMRQIEQKILRDKIREQERKFKKSRQQQIKLRQRQIEMEFNKKRANLQQTHKKRLSQYKTALIAEQKRIRKQEQIYSGERKKLTSIEYELAEKELKQKLLRKIISEKQRLKEESALLATEEQTIEKLTRELKQKQQLQLQQYQLMEKERIRMKQMYQSLIQHNKLIQQEIQSKKQVLNEFQQRRLLQQQNLSKHEAISKETNEQKDHLVNEETKTEDFDIESMKLKVKQQILTEMLKQQELNRIQQQKQAQLRRLKLKKIEQQVADVLKAQQQKLQLENAQFLAKVQSMKRESSNILLEFQNNFEKQLKPTINEQKEQAENKIAQELIQKEKEKNQNQTTVKQQQNDNLRPKQQEKSLQTQNKQHLQQKPLKLEQNQIQAAKKQNNLDKTNEKVQQNPKSQAQVQQFKVQQFGEKKGQKTIEKQIKGVQKTIKLEQKDKTIQRVNTQSKIKLKSQLIQENNIVQANLNRESQIMQKYNNLLPLLKKGTSIMVEDYNLNTFISAFLSNFDKSLRDMIPWNNETLQKNLKTKKGDIFDSGAIGWLQQKQKYYLLGSIDCLDSILKKYGCVQIHQIFHLDKSSSYQKQVIAKKIRQFQKIGFVYQKQMANNLYSIRFVFLFPSTKVQAPTVFVTTLTTTLAIQGHNDNVGQMKKNHAFSYLFARLLKETIESTQLQDQLRKQNNQFSQAIKKQLERGLFTELKGKGLQLSEGTNSIQLNVTLPLKYYRQKEKLFYLIPSLQYSFDQKLTYLSQLTQNLTIMVQPILKDNPALQLDLMTLQIVQKLSKAEKSREIDVVLPIWSYSSVASLTDCGVSYVFKEKMNSQLNVSSISTSFLKKHIFVEVRAPFIFGVCESSKGLIQKVLHSYIVSQEDVRYHKINK